MKLSSIKNIINNLKETLYRFPITSAFAVLGTFIGLVLIQFEFEPTADYSYLYNLAITSTLGFLLFLSIRLFIERYKLDFTRRALLEAGGAAFLVLYFFLLPDVWMDAHGSDFLRAFLLGLAFFFSVTFSAFLVKGEINGFWQFNKNIFIRLVFAEIYGVFLFIGMALAYTSMDQLLGIDISWKLYPQTWVFIEGILVSLFFLSGVPEDVKKLDKKMDYPKGVKFFSQYIVIPLMALYAVILSTYIGKILVTQQWPEGTVSWLILLFSIAGVLAHVLLYPQRDSEYVWIKYFSRIFFALEIPFIAVLFMAITIRLQEYGLTEARYYVVVLGLWLFGMAGYFLFSKKQNIKVIPISLFAIILLSSFGPWGAIAMSKNNQVSRLQNMLEEKNILVEGKIVPIEEKFERKELREISGALDYIGSRHGFASISPWFDQDLDQYVRDEQKKSREGKYEDRNCWQDSCYVMEKMGLAYVSRWDYVEEESPEHPQYFYYNAQRTEGLNVAGYNYFFTSYVSSYDAYRHEFEMDEKEYLLRYDENDSVIEVRKDDEVIERISTQAMIDNLQANYLGTHNEKVAQEDMTLISESGDIKIIIEDLSLKREEGVLSFESMSVKVLMK